MRSYKLAQAKRIRLATANWHQPTSFPIPTEEALTDDESDYRSSPGGSTSSSGSLVPKQEPVDFAINPTRRPSPRAISPQLLRQYKFSKRDHDDSPLSDDLPLMFEPDDLLQHSPPVGFFGSPMPALSQPQPPQAQGFMRDPYSLTDLRAIGIPPIMRMECERAVQPQDMDQDFDGDFGNTLPHRQESVQMSAFGESCEIGCPQMGCPDEQSLQGFPDSAYDAMESVVLGGRADASCNTNPGPPGGPEHNFDSVPAHASSVGPAEWKESAMPNINIPKIEPSVQAPAPAPPLRCVVVLNMRQCMVEGCVSGAVDSSKLCKKHGGGRRCSLPDCKSSAASSSNLCKKHGGGKRCQAEGCTKSAAGGGLCKKHGGGRRCTQQGCEKSASSSSDRCSRHGGGPRCQHPDCSNGAVGRSKLCISHGGGKRCAVPGCSSSSQNSTPGYCKRHGKKILEQIALSTEPALKPELDELKEFGKAPAAASPAVGSWDHFIQYQQKRMQLSGTAE